jgi:hypothetical protein
MAALSSDVPNDSQALAVVLRTTLSLLDSYAPCVRESNSLRDLERALICAISDLKRVDARERERMGQGTMQN